MQILKHILLDVVKNRMVVFYALFLLILTTSIIWFSGQEAKAVITLQNISLIAAPLIAIVFSSTYLYNSRDFIALLLTQPICRKTVFWSFFTAIAASLTLSITIGMGLPLLILNFSSTAFTLFYLTLLLNLVFVALGVWVSVKVNDKAKGLGLALLIWLFLTLVYDGLGLLVLSLFQDYPLMVPVVVITSLNPIDLSRVSLLMEMDISALMGFTGAVYRKFFGSGLGNLLALALLLAWAIIPTILSRMRFAYKDF